MTSTLTNLGRELRKLRVDMEKTMTDMAMEIGVSPSFLSAIETGKQPAPKNFIFKLVNTYEPIREKQDHYFKLVTITKKRANIKTLDPNKKYLIHRLSQTIDKFGPDEIASLETLLKRVA